MLERLGETDSFGEVLIRVLEHAGWTVHRRRAFAGDGVLLLATRPGLGFPVRAEGAAVAAAATVLFCEAARWAPIPPESETVAA